MAKKVKAKKKYLNYLFLVFLFIVACLFIFIFTKRDKNKTIINSSSNITPSPTTTNIDWNQAVNLLQECKIVSAYQANKLQITLTDKNKLVYHTTEPKKDDIVYQTNHLRSDCNDIVNVVTE